MKYYQVNTQVLNVTDIHNPVCVQFHNLWGRHAGGIKCLWQIITLTLFLAWFSISYFSLSWCLFNTYPYPSLFFPVNCTITHLLQSLCLSLFLALPLASVPLHPFSVECSSSSCHEQTACALVCVAPVGFQISACARRSTYFTIKPSTTY